MPEAATQHRLARAYEAQSHGNIQGISVGGRAVVNIDIFITVASYRITIAIIIAIITITIRKLIIKKIIAIILAVMLTCGLTAVSSEAFKTCRRAARSLVKRIQEQPGHGIWEVPKIRGT